jgi:hypothetical protein
MNQAVIGPHSQTVTIVEEYWYVLESGCMTRDVWCVHVCICKFCTLGCGECSDCWFLKTVHECCLDRPSKGVSRSTRVPQHDWHLVLKWGILVLFQWLVRSLEDALKPDQIGFVFFFFKNFSGWTFMCLVFRVSWLAISKTNCHYHAQRTLLFIYPCMYVIELRALNKLSTRLTAELYPLPRSLIFFF